MQEMIKTQLYVMPYTRG